jgi:hypothetical protein
MGPRLRIIPVLPTGGRRILLPPSAAPVTVAAVPALVAAGRELSPAVGLCDRGLELRMMEAHGLVADSGGRAVAVGVPVSIVPSWYGNPAYVPTIPAWAGVYVMTMEAGDYWTESVQSARILVATFWGVRERAAVDLPAREAIAAAVASCGYGRVSVVTPAIVAPAAGGVPC